jgi:hypothetical protein
MPRRWLDKAQGFAVAFSKTDEFLTLFDVNTEEITEVGNGFTVQSNELSSDFIKTRFTKSGAKDKN